MEVLLCRPTYFDVPGKDPQNNYMDPNDRPDKHVALGQHKHLAELYQMLGIRILYIRPVDGLVCMTFTANGGFTYKIKENRYVIVSNFKREERMGEKEYYFQFFKKNGYIIRLLPQNIFFEGSGDALWYKNKILLGYGFRTNKEATPWIEEFTNREVVPIGLKTPSAGRKNPYHLDTAIIPLPDAKKIIVYREGITSASLRRLENIAEIIPASAEDAENMALNALVVPYSDLKISVSLAKESVARAVALASTNSSGKHPHGAIVLSYKASRLLQQTLIQSGYVPITTDVSEFLKSGAGVFCLTKVL